jgi:hypothetical protein
MTAIKGINPFLLAFFICQHTHHARQIQPFYKSVPSHDWFTFGSKVVVMVKKYFASFTPFFSGKMSANLSF